MFFTRDKINIKIAVLLLIIIVGFFLRAYKFSDWMIFKGDSFRDAILISKAYENGPRELPLLGPKAGGTILRTGPIFYYFEYLATIIFQSNEAPVFAYPVLFFSLLSMPLAFIFFRKYFNQTWSLLLTGIFSVSFVMVEYSRFAWNPNPAPFFNLLFFYALLQIFDKEVIKKTRWFVAAAVAFSVATQLHYSSFFALPVIILIFLAFNFKDIRTTINWKNLVLFIGIVVLFYVPVILNDVVSQGANTKQFFASIQSKPSEDSLARKFYMDAKYFSDNFLRVMTGYFGNNKKIVFSSFLFFLAALFLNGYLFKEEKNENRKNFLLLSLIVFFVYFFLYLPLAKSVEKPRFFLPLATVPLALWGYVCVWLAEKKKLATKMALILLVFLPLASNLFYNLAWFKELYDADRKSVKERDTIVLREKKAPMWWTWNKFEKAAKYMADDCQERSIYYMLQKETQEFRNSIEYAMRGTGEKRPIHKSNNSVGYNSKACYYYVSITDSSLPEKLKNFSIDKMEVFGNMTIRRFSFREVPLKAKDQAKEDEKFVLEDKNKDDKKLNSRILSNKERLFWGDLFE
jgi:hypothetical protein